MSAPHIMNSPIYKIINKRNQEAIDDLLYHANHFYKVEVIDKSGLFAFAVKNSLALQIGLLNEQDVFKVIREHVYMDDAYIKQQLDEMFSRFEKTEKFIFSTAVLYIWNSLRNTLNIEQCFSADWAKLDSFSIDANKLSENVYAVKNRDPFENYVCYYEFKA